MEVQNLAGLGIDQARQGTAQKPAFDNKNVNDQLGATLNQGGLLMRMAQSKGQGLAASRGLGNSTIGIDAAQRAMVDAALPIAQQNAQQANSRFMQDDSQAFTAGESAKDRSQQLTMQQNDFGNQTNQAKLNAGLTEARDKLLYQQQLGTLSAEGQQRLNELNTQFGQQKELNQQQAYLQAERDTLLNKFQQGVLDKESQQRLNELNTQFGQQKELNQQQAYLQAERDTLLNKFQQGVLDKEGQQRLNELDAQLQNQAILNNQQNQWNSAEAQKDRQQQLTVLEKQFGQETAQMAQQVVANTHGMYMGAIDSAMSSYNERYAAIMADSSMKAADKQTLAANMKKELNSTLGMYQQLYSNISTIRPDWSKFPTTQLPGVKIT